MDDESWKNHGSQDDFKHGGLNVEGSSSKKKTNDIDCLRSSELSCLSVNTNVPEDGYFKHGKSIDDASSTINLDKKKREVIVEDNSFCHMHDIKAGSNRSSEGLTCRRHSSTNTSSLPCEDVNNVSFMRRKRKRDMSNLCESSSAASETSETSCNQLSTLNLYDGWSSSSSRNNSYDCDVKLDELQSPKLSLDSYLEQNLQFDDYSARVSQIEADELLARKLQEQYNQEVAGTMSTNEIDANIHGFSQEMDTLSATTTRRDQPDNVSTLIKDSHFAASSTSDLTNNRERSMTDSYACYAQLASHNSSSRSSNRSEHQSSNARRRFHSSEINFETRERNMSDLHAYYTQLASHNSSSRLSNRPQHQMSNARRSFHRPEFELETKLLAELKNFTSMDSEKRRNLMEALQAAFDQTNSALGNGDDYAVFSSLDKNARASEEQIDSLPQSIIQSGKVEEMCAICLEVPSIGDKIRHMPCLHKFHLQCIDVWLRRKACCPVCKWKLS